MSLTFFVEARPFLGVMPWEKDKVKTKTGHQPSRYNYDPAGVIVNSCSPVGVLKILTSEREFLTL